MIQIYSTLIFFFLAAASAADIWDVVSYDDQPILFPEIAFIDKSKGEHFIKEFQGSMVLVVFWASWCDVCVNELPKIDLLQKTLLKHPIKIIALSEDFKGIDKVREFYKYYNISYLEPYLDNKRYILQTLNVTSIPTSFLLNEKGYIVAKFTGVVDWQDQQIVNFLLQSAKGAYVNYNKKPNNQANTDKQKAKEFNVPDEAITYLN
jgi:thiol-disulfide isomerase/thioredoxin